MRGSLQLSLNAVVMFIVSIIVLGFGIWLVGVFLDLGTGIIEFDYCDREVERAMARGERFVICPSTIPSSQFTAQSQYRMHYAFFNVADNDNTNFKVGATSDGYRYEIQSSVLRNVPSGEWRRATFLLRLTPGEDPQRNDRVRIHICPEGGCDPITIYGDDTNPSISRQLSVNT